MKIKVVVKAGAKENAVERIGEGEFFVRLKESARKGKANQALIKLLSKYFGKQVKIVSGLRSRYKTVEII
ncbi:MAG: hypothetical protein GTN80_11270 [Nitrososphaeria archaeon]|nr:hypothetical protein [Nitrososphaeria archaeon]NIQ34198.1 hypothetical protein [Nitrososphaeria archaeon]